MYLRMHFEIIRKQEIVDFFISLNFRDAEKQILLPLQAEIIFRTIEDDKQINWFDRMSINHASTNQFSIGHAMFISLYIYI